MKILKKVRRCCVPGCNNNSKNKPSLSFFGFPKDFERAKEWAVQVRRPDLLSKEISNLHNTYKVCGQHFDNKLYPKNRLKLDAIPTIFKYNRQKRQVPNNAVKEASASNAQEVYSSDNKEGTSSNTKNNSQTEWNGTFDSMLAPANGATGVKLPVYLHVQSNQINVRLQNKIKNLIGTSSKGEGPIITNITGEQFQKICDMLSRENITL